MSLCGNGTHSQTSNFRLFQTERVWWKCQKVIQTGRKNCWKRRNCSLQAISPFPKVFSKGLFPRGVKRCHSVGMGLKAGYLWQLILFLSGAKYLPYRPSVFSVKQQKIFIFDKKLANIISKKYHEKISFLALFHPLLDDKISALSKLKAFW